MSNFTQWMKDHHGAILASIVALQNSHALGKGATTALNILSEIFASAAH